MPKCHGGLPSAVSDSRVSAPNLAPPETGHSLYRATKPPARVCFEHDGIHVCLLRRGVFTHSALVAIFREKKGGRYGKPGSSTGKTHRRHARSLWFPTDVFGLFSNNVGPFLRNLVLSGPLFSANVVRKWAMLLGQAIYVLGPLHLKDIFTPIWAGPSNREIE